MRNRVHWDSSVNRFVLALLAACALSAVFVGCGGGGGGSSSSSNNGSSNGTNGTNGTNGSSSTGLTVTGKVTDNTVNENPVAGATVTLIGAGGYTTSTTTGSNGVYTIINIPTTTTLTGFTVSSPNTSLYYNYAVFGANTYTVGSVATGGCVLPLPAAVSNVYSVGPVELYSGGNNPPPPPTSSGCPA